MGAGLPKVRSADGEFTDRADAVQVVGDDGEDIVAKILDAVKALSSPATSVPAEGDAPVGTTLIGPFAPQLNRPIWLTSSGAWTGSLVLLRSRNGGVTKLPISIGGQEWGRYYTNINEPVWEDSVAGATYYVQATITTGTAKIVLEQ